MEIVVRGRHLSQDVGDSFREHCQGKLERLGRLDHRLRRLDVELSHEPNPRMSGQCQRVEITVFSRGPVVRAESSARDCYAAFEGAFDKLEERLRRAASRRLASHSHSHHVHLPVPAAVVDVVTSVVANGTSNQAVGGHAGGDPSAAGPDFDGHAGVGHSVDGQPMGGRAHGFATGPDSARLGGTRPDDEPAGGVERDGYRSHGYAAEDGEDEAEPRLHAGGLHEVQGGLIVREKAHSPEPMDLDEAVHRMELVGHDFYLFCEQATGTPSVVYRRRGYSYGVLRLQVSPPASADAPPEAALVSSGGAPGRPRADAV